MPAYSGSSTPEETSYHSVSAEQASYMYCMRSWNVRRIPTAELKLWGMIFIFINSVMLFSVVIVAL